MKQAAETRISLWRYPDFLLLWGGQSISQIGSQVTVWACSRRRERCPPVLFGLVAGALVDRLPRRVIMIWADVGRALLIGSIPLAALFGRLSMGQLYFVAFFVGCLSILFDVAYHSYFSRLFGGFKTIQNQASHERSRLPGGLLDRYRLALGHGLGCHELVEQSPGPNRCPT